MKLTFREAYQQQQQLCRGITQYWGYSQPEQKINSKRRSFLNSPPPQLANITLRNWTLQPPKTHKIRELQQEIQDLKNEMRFNKMRQEDFDPNQVKKSPFITKMKQRFEQYNYLVQHKHLTAAGSAQTRAVLGLKSASPAQRLVQQINKTKQQLNDSKLAQQIQVNKHMTQLYRTFYKQIDQVSNSSNTDRRTHVGVSVLSNQAPSITFKQSFGENNIRQKQNSLQNRQNYIKTIKNNHNSTKQKGKIFQKIQSEKILALDKSIVSHSPKRFINTLTKQRKYSKNITGINDLEQQIDYKHLQQQKEQRILIRNQAKTQREMMQTYMDRKQAENYNKMQTTIDNSYKTLDRFRDQLKQLKKIERIRIKSSKKLKKHTKKQPCKTQRIQIKKQQIMEDMGDQMAKLKREKQEQLESYKNNQSNQLYIMSHLLKRRHLRFQKIGFGKIIKQYDQQQEAKELLNWPSDKKKDNDTRRSTDKQEKQQNQTNKNISQNIQKIKK